MCFRKNGICYLGVQEGLSSHSGLHEVIVSLDFLYLSSIYGPFPDTQFVIGSTNDERMEELRKEYVRQREANVAVLSLGGGNAVVKE